jgi:hypothetical protein
VNCRSKHGEASFPPEAVGDAATRRNGLIQCHIIGVEVMSTWYTVFFDAAHERQRGCFSWSPVLLGTSNCGMLLLELFKVTPENEQFFSKLS